MLFSNTSTLSRAQIRVLVKEATDPHMSGLCCYADLQDLVQRLAAAAELLLAENEQLAKHLKGGTENLGGLLPEFAAGPHPQTGRPGS